MEFVNFEIAELLFKLGFCEKCFGYYYQSPNAGVNNYKEDLMTEMNMKDIDTDQCKNLYGIR